MSSKKPKISKAEALRVRINEAMFAVYRAVPGDVLVLRPELDEYPYQRAPILYGTPGTGERLGDLPYDSQCEVLENQQSWNRVLVEGREGWIHAFDVVEHKTK